MWHRHSSSSASESRPLGTGSPFWGFHLLLPRMGSCLFEPACGCAFFAPPPNFFRVWPLGSPCSTVVHIGRLPWAGRVQRGRFLFKEFWTCIVLWPDTCLVELTKSYVQVAKSYLQFQSLMLRKQSSIVLFQSLMIRKQSLMFTSKVLCSGSKVQ